MPNDPLKQGSEHPAPWTQYKLVILIVGAVGIAFVIVLISMALYNASGTALLDLSRPGYQAQREQVEEGKSLKGFESTGDLDDEAIKEFRELFEDRTNHAAEWAFSDDKVLSDKELGIAENSKSQP